MPILRLISGRRCDHCHPTDRDGLNAVIETAIDRYVVVAVDQAVSVKVPMSSPMTKRYAQLGAEGCWNRWVVRQRCGTGGIDGVPADTDAIMVSWQRLKNIRH